MKLPRRSMGIPQEIHPDTIARQRAQADEAKKAARENTDPAFAMDTMQFPADSDEAGAAAGEDHGAAGQEDAPGLDEALSPEAAKAAAAAEMAKSAHPISILERIGVTVTDDDFHSYLFAGFIEKTLKICYDPLTKKPFTATFRTLTAQEYDEIDECLAEELDKLKMTGAGRDARRSVWILAFAMVKVDGRPLVEPVLKKSARGTDIVDTKATAKRRVEITRAFSAVILDKSSRLYGTFTTALSILMEDPENTYLKKP